MHHHHSALSKLLDTSVSESPPGSLALLCGLGIEILPMDAEVLGLSFVSAPSLTGASSGSQDESEKELVVLAQLPSNQIDYCNVLFIALDLGNAGSCWSQPYPQIEIPQNQMP